MITVVSPGMFTTVQDLGRWGYQVFGMPVAGAMDRYALGVVNLLAGNRADAPVLEMTMKGGSFRFDKDCYAAIGGGDMQAALNGQPVANWSSFFVQAGSELEFGYAAAGCRGYLAVHGGIDVPSVLESRSTYVKAGVGGHLGRTLQAGDVLKAGEFTAGKPQAVSLPKQFIPPANSEITLRVLLGPQDDLFEAEGIATLFGSPYTITSEADRMGYRLEGPVIRHKDKADIVSDALCQGAIQVPGHGMPIIMMADRQTTGGYTKIGTVIGPDLALLAQAKPGDSIRFVQCGDEEAVGALKTEQERYTAIEQALTALAPQPAVLGRSFKVTVNGQAYTIQIQEMV